METFARLVGGLAPEPSDVGATVWTESLTVEMPMELYARRDAAGRLQLETTPPTQIFETTMMPVFHGLRLRIAADDLERVDPERTTGDARA